MKIGSDSYTPKDVVETDIENDGRDSRVGLVETASKLEDFDGTLAVQWGPCSGSDQAQVFEIISAGNAGCPYSETAVHIFNVYNNRLYLDDSKYGYRNYDLVEFWESNTSSTEIWCVV